WPEESATRRGGRRAATGLSRARLTRGGPYARSPATAVDADRLVGSAGRVRVAGAGCLVGAGRNVVDTRDLRRVRGQPGDMDRQAPPPVAGHPAATIRKPPAGLRCVIGRNSV